MTWVLNRQEKNYLVPTTVTLSGSFDSLGLCVIIIHLA